MLKLNSDCYSDSVRMCTCCSFQKAFRTWLHPVRAGSDNHLFIYFSVKPLQTQLNTTRLQKCCAGPVSRSRRLHIQGDLVASPAATYLHRSARKPPSPREPWLHLVCSLPSTCLIHPYFSDGFISVLNFKLLYFLELKATDPSLSSSSVAPLPDCRRLRGSG